MNIAAKGVVAEIWNNEDMPVDDFGNRADMVIASETTVNRMNPSQLWEQWINYVSTFVVQQAKSLSNKEQTYLHIQSFINMINPEYSKLVDEIVKDSSDGLELYLENVYKNGIMLVCPPFLETIIPTLALQLKEQFNIPLSPVEFNIRTEDGQLIRRVRTRKPIIIGSKYIYLLCKVPKTRSSGVSNINQLKLPVRQHAKTKHLSPISKTPIRTGEDEIRQILLATSPETTSRFLSLYSNSHAGIEAVTDTLLTTKNPSAIRSIDMTTDELNETNKAVGCLRHMGSAFGCDLKNVKVSK